MTKTAGYTVKLTAFIPAPRDNFAMQARAAMTMDELVNGGVITPNFVDLAQVLDVTAKHGTVDLPDTPLPDVDPADMEGGETDRGDEPLTGEELPPLNQEPRQKRSSPKA